MLGTESDPPSPLPQGGDCKFDDLRFRLPSPSEHRRAKGHFSNCTLPVILFSNWVHSYGGVECTEV